ncbi:MAG: GntR family transcriptional regulator [Sphaerochaeta sp.]|jgi:DNA-binding GntR family transcriptional regulator|uniref:GntR family transcriptional regulator n=1 Tax=unclassified Sphaerochaeta TaxID=2637943 RepID=UPI000A72865B|nr:MULTISPECIES: GntR family transcriptional regulator [unclassified Sphaerochaeta]MCK9599266.1 GntR family transcriptional regulator [Sphaerochaeta sp.]MDX9824294.1 GntR family transcriptional regulator [Sphaerochaeta sp.]MEA4864203.1 GntR family transcriptional regulator [Sphaerochaeta sp.]HCU30743.1 GntR family transcriptional regulator [Sphaerochaeta sp.]HPE93829.1 GntR family transcriptional regulator [Sphaerochaeta sp.]
MKQEQVAVIDKRSLAEQVYQYLCDSIIGGRFNYGDTLSTKQLAKELDVSMMPIREALKRLEIDGLVEIRPRSMCLLKTPTKKTILSAIAMRELLEVYSVKSVYETIEKERLEPLKALTSSMAEALAQEDLHTYIKFDCQYHLMLCSLCDNEFIHRSYKELNLHLNMKYMYDIGIKPDYSQTFQDHIDLLNALEHHSPAALQIIEKHLHTSKKNILSGAFLAGDEESQSIK